MLLKHNKNVENTQLNILKHKIMLLRFKMKLLNLTFNDNNS